MTTDRAAIAVRPRRSAPAPTSRRDAGGRAPHAATLRCLHADVALTEPTVRLELRRARAQAVRGDQAWRERLQAYEHGDTLTAHAVIDDAGGDTHLQPPCGYCDEAVWIDRDTAPRVLADRLRALALRAFATVAAGLRDRGTNLSARDDEITVEITVDPAITAQLGSAPEHDSAGPSTDPT